MRSLVILDSPRGELRSLLATVRSCAGADTEVETVASVDALAARIRSGNTPDLVILDSSQEQELAQLRRLDRDLPVVVVAERGDVDTAERAVRAGASDFLVRGPQLEQRVRTLLGKVSRLFRLKDRVLAQDPLPTARFHMVGLSKPIQDILATIERVARIPRPVLVTGERGTGKELVARAIHARGGSPTRPLVTMNCAAFSEALIESELFGHEKGAFTGATSARAGRFEQADGGTLFLDEIGHMPLPFQQKLLRVVEYGTFTRVGGQEELHVDVRLIAATNADLADKIGRGEFLPDLYDRLAFEVIHIPPLRERPGDVEILTRHFLEQFGREIPAFRGKRLSAAALAALKRHRFPGNLRELKNLIERAAYRDTGEEITPDDLGLPVDAAPTAATGTFRDRVESLERKLLADALRDAQGNQAEAARRLGLSYHQFRYYARKHRVENRTP